MDEQVSRRILFDFEVITLITMIFGLALYALIRKRATAPARHGIGSEFGPLDLVLVIFPLSLFLLNPILGYLMPSSETQPSDPSVAQQFMTGIMQLIYFIFIGLITIVILHWLLMRDAIELLGLRRMNWKMILLVGISGTFLSVVLCNLVVGHFSNSFLSERLGELGAQQAVQDLKNARSLPMIILSIVLACIAAPLVEETLFRGYLYGALKRFSSPLFAALISGALFAVVHMNLPALLPLWLFALILTLSYEATRCLWVPITIHALFNATNIAMLFLERWLSQGA